jgi:hypothetical protein
VALQNDIVADDECILLVLRNAVKVERDGLIRTMLKSTADGLQQQIKLLGEKPTPHLMRTVNCLWIRAIHYLSIAKGGPKDDGPLAPSVSDVAQFVEAA